jgi:hypothetical protein
MQDVRAIRERLAAMLALSDENLLDVAVVVSREPVAISQLGAGAVTSRDIGTSGGSSKRCVDSPHILDVGGTSHTGDDGSFGNPTQRFLLQTSRLVLHRLLPAD